MRSFLSLLALDSLHIRFIAFCARAAHPFNSDSANEDDVGERTRKTFLAIQVRRRRGYVTPQARRSLYITATVLIVLGVLCFTVILIGVLSHSGIASWDKPHAQWMYAHRSPDVTAVMIVLTITSGPVVLPISSSSSPLSGSSLPNMRSSR